MDARQFPTLDPDLVPIVEMLPEAVDAFDDLAGAREMLASFALADVDTTGLEVTDVPLAELGSPVSARIYRPVGAGGPLPGLLHLHGGGFCLGGVDTEHGASVQLARELGAVVVAVEYRLAPEHPYPAGLEDCFAGLRLLASLDGVDPGRVAVHGMSAGGGLAAAVALLARDRGGPRVCFQSLVVPEIDDRLETPSMRAFTRTPMWSRRQAEKSWELYLGGQAADHYAAPARAEDLAGLPPAYVVACELDPLRDEGLTYGMRLMEAGVSVELHSFPGTFHGVQLAQGTPVVRRMDEELMGALRRALHGC